VTVEVRREPATFCDWEAVLKLLQAAFAYQDDRIDPKSSVHALDAASIASKAREEHLFIALDEGELIGCVFARAEPGALYVGKLAVLPPRQGEGIGRRLMQATEEFARQTDHKVMELDTRIELIENHETFAAMGYVKTGEHAHEGYDHPTFITMQKLLD